MRSSIGSVMFTDVISMNIFYYNTVI